MDENKNEKKEESPEEKKTFRWMHKKMPQMPHDGLKWILIGIAGLVIIVLVFAVGIFIGGAKARFSYRWAENYQQNFAGPRQGFLGDWRGMPSMPMPGDFIESRGAFGEIIKINDADFVMKGRDNVEKVILIDQDTVIEQAGNTLKKEDLKVGDSVVVIGSPNEQGQILAEFIRVFR